MVTENTHIVDFRLNRKIFTLYLLFCTSVSIAHVKPTGCSVVSSD